MLLLASLPPVLCLGQSWSGVLVDSKCYEALQRNVNPNDTLTSVDRDTNRDIRYCSPGAKTKHFTLVEPVGASFRLDAAGDTKASLVLRAAGKKAPVYVTVNGERKGNSINVDSISNLP
jgi:hypothetical protein